MRRGVVSLRAVAVALTWLVLAGLVLVTLVPIGLRPHTEFSAQAERFIGFAIAGLCVSLAYPRRPLLTILLLALLATGLEAAQFLAATRHPGLPDMLAKLLGAASGLALGWGIRTVATALRRPPTAGE